jgi:hypothetical protein
VSPFIVQTTLLPDRQRQCLSEFLYISDLQTSEIELAAEYGCAKLHLLPAE